MWASRRRKKLQTRKSIKIMSSNNKSIIPHQRHNKIKQNQPNKLFHKQTGWNSLISLLSNNSLLLLSKIYAVRSQCYHVTYRVRLSLSHKNKMNNQHFKHKQSRTKQQNPSLQLNRYVRDRKLL